MKLHLEININEDMQKASEEPACSDDHMMIYVKKAFQFELECWAALFDHIPRVEEEQGLLLNLFQGLGRHSYMRYTYSMCGRRAEHMTIHLP